MTEAKQKVHAIKGTAFWCNHARPSKFGGYGVELGRLDDKTVKGLKALGIPVKYDMDNDKDSPDFKGAFIKIKNDSPVVAKDMMGNNLPAALNIGNGSITWAAFRAKPWTHKETGRSGVRAILLGLKVVELVEYDPEASNRAKADTLLDGISGEGFVFSGGADQPEGEMPDEESYDQEDVDSLFNDE